MANIANLPTTAEEIAALDLLIEVFLANTKLCGPSQNREDLRKRKCRSRSRVASKQGTMGLPSIVLGPPADSEKYSYFDLPERPEMLSPSHFNNVLYEAHGAHGGTYKHATGARFVETSPLKIRRTRASNCTTAIAVGPAGLKESSSAHFGLDNSSMSSPLTLFEALVSTTLLSS